MNKPEITKSISGYSFNWSDSGIIIDVSRIKTHKDDRVTGELLVQAVNGNGNTITIFPPTSYNFSADRTRKELAESLSKRTPKAKLPWQDMVDQLCTGIQTRVREGEPVTKLTTNYEIKRPEYLLYPLIIKNYPNIIFGDPSAAKSTLAIILAQVLMLPWVDNSMGITAPIKPVKVLYLDWETDEDTILWQTTMLERGMELGLLEIDYRHCSIPLTSDIQEIKRHVGSLGTEVAIIDSLGLACGGELNETQAPLGFYAALRELRITTLVLAHNSKDRESKKRSIYGNQFFTAGARNVWEIRKSQEYSSNEMDLALFHIKPPPLSGLHKALGFKVVFGEDTMQIEQRDPQTVSEFVEQMGSKQRILELLKEGPMTTGEIKERLEITRGNADTTLKRLKDRKLVIKSGDKWGLIRSDNESI